MKFTVDDWRSGKQPPKGWDFADAVRDDWSSDDIIAFIKKYVSPVKKPKASAPQQPQEPAPSTAAVTQVKQTQQEIPAEIVDIKTRARLASDDAWMRHCVFNAEGKPKPKAVVNQQLYLTHHQDVDGMLAWNKFTREIMMMGCPPWEDPDSWVARPVQDTDNVNIVSWLERSAELSPTVTGIFSVVAAVAEKNAFDPLADYLNGLRWDGKPRVADFLRDHIGGDDTDYTRIISKRWLISAVARALDPGCKMDTMLVLEGPQGALKSSAVRELFGSDFFTDQISDFESKDAKQEIQGVWAIEVAEMDRITKAEQNAVKRFLSHQFDRFRPPYGRNVVKADRRCILVGTINPDGTGYLQDTTGARRFWPVKVGAIDLEGIKRDRDQIWAEAVTLFKSGEMWWAQPDELDVIEEQQSDRTEVDIWEPILREGIGLLMEEVTMKRCIDILELPKERADHRHVVRIGRILRLLGYKRKRVRMEDGRRDVIYVKNTRPE